MRLMDWRIGAFLVAMMAHRSFALQITQVSSDSIAPTRHIREQGQMNSFSVAKPSSTHESVATSHANAKQGPQPTVSNSDRWNERFQELVLFKQNYGHTNVPQSPTKNIQSPYTQLSNFCRNQRIQYKYHQKEETRHLSFLTQDRIEQLESVGFVWNSHANTWTAKYKELVRFWKVHGHTNVSPKTADKSLCSWVSFQRMRYKGNKNTKPLSKLETKLLERIGFRWSPKDELWWSNFAELKVVKQKTGSLETVSSPGLRRWRNSLRRQCKEYVLAVSIEGTTDGVRISGLNRDRLNALREIGFCWLPSSDR